MASGVGDPCSICSERLRGGPVKVVVAEGFDEAAGPGDDISRALNRSFRSRHAERTVQLNNAQTSAKTLLRMCCD